MGVNTIEAAASNVQSSERFHLGCVASVRDQFLAETRKVIQA